MLFDAHTKLVGHRETCRFVCGSIAVYSACIDAIVAGKISQSFQEVSTVTKLIFFSRLLSLLVITLADVMCRRFGRGLVFSSANRLHLF